MRRHWKLAPRDPDIAKKLTADLNVHPVVSEILVGRGVQTVEGARKRLSRRLADLHDPGLLPGVTEAADLLSRRAREGKVICIYGDYDVDGMCATAILLECLRLAGVTARFYVPDRLEEGYGLKCDALSRLKEQGVDVVVSVDCGVGSALEAEHARAIGLELIITDHHELGDRIAPADVVVHPRLPDSTYPWGELCGAGVAFKLAWELARRFSGGRKTTDPFQAFLLNATSLAAIGTVCDVVPLVDENRVLVHHGLVALKERCPIGLQALRDVAGGSERNRLDAYEVGFGIGPRLNACGRLGQARLGVELLVTRDLARARELALHLDEQNKARQTLERRIFQEAKELAESRYDLESPDCSAIVLAADGWHAGVVGIVAGRIAERYHRPTILIAMGETEGTGSGRSIQGIHLQQALLACRSLLLAAGGHEMAAGVRVHREALDAFRSAFEAEVAARGRPEHRRPCVSIDAEAPISILSPRVVESLDVLAPFGATNPAPTLLATNLTVMGEPKKMGGGERHLAFHVGQGNARLRAVAFGQADRVEELMSQDGRCCLVYSPRINVFRGYPEVELQVKDFRPGARIEDEVPSCPITPT